MRVAASLEWTVRGVAMSYGWRTVDGRDVEICDECGFDGRDVGNESVDLAEVLDRLAALDDRHDAHRRPQSDIWSASEYIEHSVEVIAGILGYVAGVLGAQEPEVNDLQSGARAVATMVPAITDDQRGLLLRNEYPFPVSVEWLLRHLLHDLQHHVLDIRRGAARIALTDLPEVYTVRRERPL
jgi:hypothetical protein